MRPNRCLPVLALLLFFPVQADEGRKAPSKSEGSQPDCCAREEGADKALCPKGKANKTKKRTATKSKTAPASGTPAAAEASPAPGMANMVVTKDPETGELRPATAAERAKLFAGRAPLAAPKPARVVILPDGTEMVELGEETMSYAVATRAPDGTVTKSCVHGPDAATEARKAPRPAPALAPRAEER